MGARHVAYGAMPEHYPVVGEVLIGAMAKVAGPEWRPQYTAQWQSAFAIVAGAMIAGAERGAHDRRVSCSTVRSASAVNAGLDSR